MPKSHPEYDALYAAVCADPDDDTARLVLADWLDEHDDPHRAAFIRAQVAIAQLREADPHSAAVYDFFVATREFPYWGLHVDPVAISPAVGRLAEFQKQAKKHAKKARDRWKEVLPRRNMGKVTACERGFPYRIEINTIGRYPRSKTPGPAEPFPDYELAFISPDEDTVAGLCEPGRAAGLRGIVLSESFPAEVVRRLGRCADVKNVRRLSLEPEEEHEEVLAAVAEPNWSGLTRLSFGTQQAVSVDWPDAPRMAKHLRGLVSLKFDYCAVSSSSFAALAREKWPRLRELEARMCSISANGLRGVVAGNFPELRTLNLGANWFSDRGAAVLAKCRTLPNLATLTLDANHFRDGKLLSALIAGPAFPALTCLDLSNNGDCGTLDPKTLAADGRGPTLRLLSLRLCALGAKSVGALASAPALTGLVALELSENKLGDAGVKSLVRNAKWDKLTCLSLSSNGITAEGVKALVKWPHLAKLACLNLCRNPIGLAGAKALAACTALSKCQKLVIPDGDFLSASGSALLHKAFGKRLSYY